MANSKRHTPPKMPQTVQTWSGAQLRQGYGTEIDRVERVELDLASGDLNHYRVLLRDGGEEWVRPLRPEDAVPGGFKWVGLTPERGREVARAAALGVPPPGAGGDATGSEPPLRQMQLAARTCFDFSQMTNDEMKVYRPEVLEFLRSTVPRAEMSDDVRGMCARVTKMIEVEWARLQRLERIERWKRPVGFALLLVLLVVLLVYFLGSRRRRPVTSS